jgi:hypothetical protein
VSGSCLGVRDALGEAVQEQLQAELEEPVEVQSKSKLGRAAMLDNIGNRPDAKIVVSVWSCDAIHSSLVMPLSCSAWTSDSRFTAVAWTYPAIVTATYGMVEGSRPRPSTARVAHSVWAIPLGAGIGRVREMTRVIRGWRR